ncbi:hypothetical protein [Rickettsia endosymbiont of Ixodes scapularis]|uniref:hypothetical protein n=1 Tax=Rickettsia endosymbiont of Ixodes scapularis TaxID=444612 RepID=UPI0019D70B10|nr:hypothetical protein [Rickettsia endosymbiont of Ixodes scapularis]
MIIVLYFISAVSTLQYLIKVTGNNCWIIKKLCDQFGDITTYNNTYTINKS